MVVDVWTRCPGPRRGAAVVRGLVVCLAAALAGCGDSDPGREEAGAASSAATRSAAAGGPDPPELVIGFIRDDSPRAEAVLAGVRFGASEVAHTARLVGGSVSLLRVDAASPRATRAAARRLVELGAVALVGGFDERSCRALAAAARREHVVFLNVGCRSAALRRSPPAGVLHVEASDSAYLVAARAAEAADTTVLWHPRLSRYGAAQLNNRFIRGGIRTPGGEAWAGWMAVKVLWEAVRESGDSARGGVEEILTSGALAFDGHKGEPLRFDRATGQLLQPLYAVRSDQLAAAARGGGSTAPGAAPPAALEPGSYLVVSNEGSADVSVIDLDTHRVVSRIPVGARPRGIHASPGGTRILVALSDDAPRSESDLDGIAVLDLSRGELVGRFEAGSDPEQFAISPNGRWLYSANEDAGTASVTDLRSGAVPATLIVGIEPEGVAVSPDGRWVYVTAETSNTVSVIDTRIDEVVASFLVDARPRGVAFSPTAPRAYVTNEIGGTLSVIDTNEHRVIASVPLDPDGLAKPVGVAVTPDGRRVYVANGHAHSVSVIDAETNRLTARIPVGRRPWGIAVSGDGTRAYTANGGSDDVSVIDVSTGRVVATVPVGSRPWGVALAEVHRQP